MACHGNKKRKTSTNKRKRPISKEECQLAVHRQAIPKKEKKETFSDINYLQMKKT
jgi:hypothetical protein